MRKILLPVLMAICAVCCMAAALSACSPKSNIEEPMSDYEPYGEDIDYRFSITSEEECPAGNITDDKLHSELSLQNGKTYYLVLDVTFKNFNWAGDRFQIKTTISDKTSLRATLQEAATGDFEQEEDEYSYMVYTRYNVPTNREAEKSYRIVYDINISAEIFMLGANFEVDELGVSESFSASNAFKYTEDPKNGTCAVSGVSGNLKNLIIPSRHGGYRVTEIADKAFSKNRDIKKISLPYGINRIGEEAFANCWLTSINIPESVTSIGRNAFADCNEDLFIFSSAIGYLDNWAVWRSRVYDYSRLEFEDGTKGIADYLFDDCPEVDSISIPKSVTSVGFAAFIGCTKLKYIYVPFTGNGSDKTHFGYIFGAETYKENYNSIPKSLINIHITGTAIGDYAFYECSFLDCSSLYNMTYNTIGNYAFYKCSGLWREFGITLDVHSIGDYAFYGCSGIRSINAVRLVSIGNYAFYGCSALEDFVTDDKLTSIGYRAFKNCNSLDYFYSGAVLDNWRVSKNSDMSGPLKIDYPIYDDYDFFETCLRKTYADYYWRRYE